MSDDRGQWAQFFDRHAIEYMDNVFTGNTLAEVDFLLALMPVQPGDRLLDIGCGTGRHSLELARRGYRMTGVDISAGMLAQAQEAAAAEGLQVTWPCAYLASKPCIFGAARPAIGTAGRWIWTKSSSWPWPAGRERGGGSDKTAAS